MRRLTSRWANLPLRRKGLVVVALPVAALLTATLFGYLAQQESDDEQRAVADVVRVRGQIQSVLRLLLNAETGVRGYDLSEDPSFLGPYEEAFKLLPGALTTLDELVGDNPGQAARATQIRFLTGQKLEVLAEMSGRAESGLSTQILNQDERLMNELRTELDMMLTTEEARLAVRREELARAQRLQRIVFAGAIGIGLAGGILAMLLFTTGIAHRVARIAGSARRLAEGAPLPERPEGQDEIGVAAEALGQASQLLSDREARLLEAKDRAERANWAKSDFLSQTSHELRTPLTAIRGFAQYMSRQELKAEQIEIMNRIVNAGEHLTVLLNDVLDIARIEAGSLAITLEPVSIDGTVRDAVALMAQIADEHNVRVEVNMGECTAASVMADQKRLSQILINLLSNAIKYNKPGGRVTVSAYYEKPNELRLLVTDEGPGIAQEDMDRLFQPYDRLGAEGSPVKGLGLGLTISKSLAALMDGRVEVRSVIGEGSTFSVVLPVAKQVAEPAEPGRRLDPVLDLDWR